MTRAALVLAAVVAALAFAALAARADTPVAARTIRANSIIAPADLTTTPGEVPGAITDPALIVGQEARVALYAGRPVMPGDVGPPALVERNQIVKLVYDAGGLSASPPRAALSAAAAWAIPCAS